MTTSTAEVTRPPRLSLSEIVRMMLTRDARGASTVTLSLNARGETQIEVSARADGEDIPTIEAAERIAAAVFDRLREKYPRSGEEAANASVGLTRNAKGETQIALELKSGDGGPPTLDLAAAEAMAAYDAIRMAYPMADGYTAKPGSVAGGK